MSATDCSFEVELVDMDPPESVVNSPEVKLLLGFTHDTDPTVSELTTDIEELEPELLVLPANPSEFSPTIPELIPKILELAFSPLMSAPSDITVSLAS